MATIPAPDLGRGALRRGSCPDGIANGPRMGLEHQLSPGVGITIRTSARTWLHGSSDRGSSRCGRDDCRFLHRTGSAGTGRVFLVWCHFPEASRPCSRGEDRCDGLAGQRLAGGSRCADCHGDFLSFHLPASARSENDGADRSSPRFAFVMRLSSRCPMPAIPAPRERSRQPDAGRGDPTAPSHPGFLGERIIRRRSSCGVSSRTCPSEEGRLVVEHRCISRGGASLVQSGGLVARPPIPRGSGSALRSGCGSSNRKPFGLCRRFARPLRKEVWPPEISPEVPSCDCRDLLTPQRNQTSNHHGQNSHITEMVPRCGPRRPVPGLFRPHPDPGLCRRS